ncbi:ras-associating and dilute domain-containing protein-like isoform X1 [Etheostoma spectabile]|uniref:ras-associating and dilute domain-containing protein-like isoform X1 n=1 Tax=Etheostoma spectabile TaxID=54343 RepID=UPI0013AF1E5C|nr:ras-associating and dilute domain-containing protein-like isoform X1 [Etheostoma spectabile]XP_032392935.1 ras-associating and dilute domain-containing protein-like isoform X1 [Etheostoma spectabile]XP_032392936.1 ras-associating and dilute domain-containing protein-like isoform X1 [Etheostoma spectabile]
MISEERSSHVNKQALNFPVGLLIRSPKKRLAKLGRKPSNGSVQSNNSDITIRSTESVGVRQPAKSKIRRHNNRISTVFNHSPNSGRRTQALGSGHLAADCQAADDPAELSSLMSVPGILKVFGSDICQGTNYKSVLATTQSSAKELVKEALERYCLEKEDANNYVLCDVIGKTGADNQWRRECFRVVGDNEKPLMLQSLWKPKEGFSRRFEIQLRASVEEQSLKDRDTVTAGINAQARKLQKSRSRVTSLFVDGSGEDVDGLGIWRSLSEMDLSAMGKEASRAQQSALREDPEAEADKDVLRLGMEKEETESSDDNTTQYSIHPPFDFPYFLLLQGYSHRQDFVIYLMSGTTTIFGCCREHCNGEDEERLKVDILLFAPDVLPQHCCVRRLDSSTGEHRKTLTMLKPLHGAPVTRNGFLLKEEEELNPGDLVGLGKHYLFMFKDPTSTSGSLQTPPWMTTLCPNADTKTSSSCLSCGSSVTIKKLKRKPLPPLWRDLEGTEAVVIYELEQEERVLQEILDMLDPSGSEPKLTPAFLLSLCIQHSAATFELTHFRQLLLRIASQIQLVMWEKTKELAAIQTEMSSSDGQPEHVQLFSMEELIPGLQPLVLWMANSIELLHFIQHDVPQLLQGQEDEGLLDSEMSSTRTACEEAMTVLEEVIMFTFQQSVYYLTKSMYSALPGLLDGNPFSEGGQLRVPDGLAGILEVLKEALKLLTAFQVHPDISLQLCAYLFFFINASLFNALMERGSVAGFYQWSRGVQIRANLDLLMDWILSIGLGDLASEFFQKLSAAVNLLATPKETLLQASWASLRTEFAALNAAQLHHMLREYSSVKACPAGWTPSPEDAEDTVRTADILESFDNHPPLILPSSTFHLELGKPVVEPALFQQLGHLQEFIRRLPRRETRAEPDAEEQTVNGTTTDRQSPTSPSVNVFQDPAHQGVSDPVTCPSPEVDRDHSHAAEPPQARGSLGDLSGCEAVLTQKLRSLELQNTLTGQADMTYHKSLALDPSCLLTPPNTPQGMELAELEADLQEGTRQQQKASRCDERKTENVEKENEEEDREEVFTAELHRGPHGLGLALVDGTQTPLRISGIYVKSVVPDSPAAQCQKLRTGDRILAVNGISVVGMEYNTGRELIRSSGDSLRLLVAKIDSKTGNRSSATTKC